MKIVLWGTYDSGKPRIRILRDGLRAQGVQVIEIHADVWRDVDDKSVVRGARAWLSRGLRLLAAYPRLVWCYLRTGAHDIVVVSYPAQLDILVLRIFASLRRKPVVFDWFISAYDTVVLDRSLVRTDSLAARMLWVLEWLAVRAADLAIMDTAAHARRMERMFRVAPGTLGHVWVGAEAAFFGRTAPAMRDGDLRVFFYGQFIPLHGIDTIVEAARILRDAPVRWMLIGRGQESARIRAMLDAAPLPKLQWVDWAEYAELPRWLADADLCLGIFGTSDKAACVIPNKVFQIIAAGRPLVTRDSNAVRELVADGSPCVSLVAPGDATALAGAISALLPSLRGVARSNCFAALQPRITPSAIGEQFLTCVDAKLPRLEEGHDH